MKSRQVQAGIALWLLAVLLLFWLHPLYALIFSLVWLTFGIIALYFENRS